MHHFNNPISSELPKEPVTTRDYIVSFSISFTNSVQAKGV